MKVDDTTMKAGLLSGVVTFLERRKYTAKRNGSILYQFALGKSKEDIGAMYGLSTERVRQILQREILMLQGGAHWDGYAALEERYKELQDEYDTLSFKYNALNKVAKHRLALKSSIADMQDNTIKVLKCRVCEPCLGLSVRALNCLKAADIEYIWQLVSSNKSELRKYRNFGKKSLRELEDLVDSFGLQWGMNLKGIIE